MEKVNPFQLFEELKNRKDASWSVYYKKGLVKRKVIRYGLTKEIAIKLYNIVSNNIPDEYDSVEIVDESTNKNK